MCSQQLHPATAHSTGSSDQGCCSSNWEGQSSSSGNATSSSSSSGSSPEAISSSSSSSSGDSGSSGCVLLYLELQVRTAAMHAAAEGGEAAHAGYKGRLEQSQVQQLYLSSTTLALHALHALHLSVLHLLAAVMQHGGPAQSAALMQQQQALREWERVQASRAARQ